MYMYVTCTCMILIGMLILIDVCLQFLSVYFKFEFVGLCGDFAYDGF